MKPTGQSSADSLQAHSSSGTTGALSARRSRRGALLLVGHVRRVAIGRAAETRRDLGDRRPLGVADARSALPVRACHLAGEREDEAPVAFDLTRRRFTLEQLDRVPQMPKAVR